MDAVNGRRVTGRLLAGLGSLARAVADAGFPRRCLATDVVLGPDERGFAAAVRAAADRLAAQPYCPRCGSAVLELDRHARRCPACDRYPVRWRRLTRIADYQGVWADAIRAYKFAGRLDGRRLLAEYLAAALRDRPAPAAIVTVPQHWRRTLHRGFNPVRLLAETLAERLAVPLAPLLRRTRFAPGLMGASRAQRLAAVAGWYALRRWPIGLDRLRTRAAASDPPAAVLLLDDLCTTRSTLAACTALLAGAGLAVDVAVLAAAEQR